MVETSPAPLTGVLIWEQSLTYQYWEFPVPGIFHCFGGIGTNWYREKVSEPVSEKFGTGKKSRNRYRKDLVPKKVPVSVSTEFRCQNLGILKIFNGYRYRIGTGTENFSFFWWYRNQYRKKMVPEKVSEPVLVIFGIGKKSGNRYRKNLVLKKGTGIGIENI